MSSVDKLKAWLTSPDAKLLDLRSEIKNSRCVINSCWIPISDLADRDEINQARFIQEKGWSVSHIFIGSSQFWAEAEVIGASVPLPAPYLPLKLLFSPAPFLSQWFEYIEETLAKSELPLKSTVRTCIDVGCGSGRDLGWVGFLKTDWNLVGLDCVEKTLNRAQKLLKNLGVSRERVCFLQAKFLTSGGIQIFSGASKKVVSSTEDMLEIATKEISLNALSLKYDLVLCIRCLQRESFVHLRNLVRPGGFLLFSTFVDGYSEYPYDHPSVESGMRLRRKELDESFGESFGFRVISDVIEVIEDGRPVNSFLAQKL
ncbi:hypothetical protein DSO57_1039165 [Entomophthora muscae]|uniref:Uncharacterized protein n=1 Tax=Entomophthora muscae TaxID=34485 RepID=A0ACC2U868_9FUNG|nr:hypothetical protein DSO57_1039165 [Entomophthora muscae]